MSQITGLIGSMVLMSTRVSFRVTEREKSSLLNWKLLRVPVYKGRWVSVIAP